MKKILIITSGFPPKSNLAAFRSESLFKHLQNYNFETYVLTSTEKDNDLEETKKERIFRVPYSNVSLIGSLKFWGKITPVDSDILWYFHSKKIYKKMKEKNIDIIISTSPTNTTHIIASDLSNYLDCKWIAEFRDLWVGNPYGWYLNSFFKKLESKTENYILKNANVLAAVNPVWLNVLEKRYPDKKKALIRVGYDENKVDDIKYQNPSGTFTISYTGSFYLSQRHITRSPYYFLKAIKKIYEKKLIPKNKININFIGIESSQQQIVLDMIKELNIPLEMINISGKVNHEKALESSAKSDINLLIEESNSLPRKLYDYLMVKRPILALVNPSSPVRDIVNKTKSGYCVSQEKTDSIVDFILRRYHNRHSFNNFEFDIDEFSEHKEIKKLVEIIDEVCD